MSRWPVTAAWRPIQVLAVLAVLIAVAHACWRLFGQIPYQIDTDVYRMGGRAWLDQRPLYAGGATFRTEVGLELPFTYPPLSAILFSPLALVSLPVAGMAISTVTLLLLAVSMWIVLSSLEVAGGARRWLLAVGIAAVSVTALEPVWANFYFGQINVVLMTLVIADCLPRRTPWPRGLLLGVAIALKLTPAVFLLYFALRRDGRAIAWAAGSFAAATAVGCALAWPDSWQYWTVTIGDTGRIGTATWNTNQNLAGALARLPLAQTPRFALWTLACLAVLALTVWAVRRVVDHEPTLALIFVALFGLVVSPVSWSHHWVWALPAVTVLAVLALRRRTSRRDSATLGLLAAAGIALMVWPPLELLPEHNEAGAAWWRQLLGISYVWWALAVIALGALSDGHRQRLSTSAGTQTGLSPRQSPGSAHPADLAPGA